MSLDTVAVVGAALLSGLFVLAGPVLVGTGIRLRDVEQVSIGVVILLIGVLFIFMTRTFIALAVS